jgi:BatD DUF11 like domain
MFSSLTQPIKCLLLLLLTSILGAQTLSTQLSRNEMAVGETAVLQINIDGIKLSDKIEMAVKNQLLPKDFEPVSDQSHQQEFKFSRTIEFAIYNEGQFNLPSLQVKVNGQTLSSVPYNIKVINPAEANAKALNDIMDVKRLPLSWQDYWETYKFYLLAIVAFVALIFLIVGFWKYARKQKIEAQKPSNKYQKALEMLKAKQYIENEESRLFYIELIDIARAFLAQQYHFPAMELLTDDLLALIAKNNQMSPAATDIVASVFPRADMAKFAKIQWPAQQMQADYQAIEKLIALPVVDLETENLRPHV